MQIVLNADDFGFDDDTVDATSLCLDRGHVTSATIMANMPATARAIDYARRHPERSFGVHLTYVGDGIERSLLPASSVPMLAEPGGLLRNSNRARLLGLFDRMPVDQIERETTAQLAFVRDHGVPISHVDSHGHLHKFEPFQRALWRVLPRFGVRRVRNVQAVFAAPQPLSYTYWLARGMRSRLMERFRTTPHFFMPKGAPDERWWETVWPRLAKLDGGPIEVGVHPGTIDGWRKNQLEGVARFHDEAVRRGHAIIGWKNV